MHNHDPVRSRTDSFIDWQMTVKSFLSDMFRDVGKFFSSSIWDLYYMKKIISYFSEGVSSGSMTYS